jgi:hypothetical protein
MLDEITAVTGFHRKHAMRLRHGRIYPGKSSWGGRHARWLAEQAFAHRRIISFFKRRSTPREVRPSK